MTCATDKGCPSQSPWIEPTWPAPARIGAISTTRLGGVSQGPFASLNLADHVGDDPASVARNRAILAERHALPAEPGWLSQVHGCAVAAPGSTDPGLAHPIQADAAIAIQPGIVCAVLTADCLPVLICDRHGSEIAAVHAGWRGLAAGVIEAAVARLAAAPCELLAWLGPAIGPAAFEVGTDVRERFVAADRAAAAAFHPYRTGKWLADIYRLAHHRLAHLGVSQVWGGEYCTYSDPERFFSFRRDGRCGRMASLIWLRSDR